MADRPGDPERTAAQQAGDAAEALVAARLADAGWTVLARNVHVGRHELDLVAVDPGPPAALVVVEVRWRAGRDFGLPEETVDHRKRVRVRAAAYGLLDRGVLPDGSPVPQAAAALRPGRRRARRSRRATTGTPCDAADRPSPCYTPARFGIGPSRRPTRSPALVAWSSHADRSDRDGAGQALTGHRPPATRSAEEETDRRSRTVPSVSMRQLLEAGVHFGHQTRRWNPKMKPFIFAERNGIHIIDLAQTVQRLDVALEFVRETVARGDQVLFVGTKKQAQEPVAQEATRANQPYVNKRWLGGMLTNFVTIKKRIGLLEQLEARQANGDFERMTKKEAAKLTEEMTKLQGTLGGMRKMKRLPGAIFIVDPHRERIAVTEANKLEIPVVGTGDTNVDPDELDYIIPANDDAIRAIRLLCTLVADAAIEGAQRALRPERDRARADRGHGHARGGRGSARRDRRARRRPGRWRRAVVRARRRRRRPAAR